MSEGQKQDFLVTLQHGSGQEIFWEQEYRDITYEELAEIIFNDELDEKDWGLAIVWERDSWGGYDNEAAHIFKDADGIFAS